MLIMKKIIAIILFLIILSTVAYSKDDSEIIFGSEELIIEKQLVGGFTISGATRPLDWVSIDYNYFPIEDYRQIILSEVHTPDYKSKDDGIINYYFENINQGKEIKSIYLIKTENKYMEINKRVEFPVSNLPSDVLQYTKPTDSIDITPAIRATASTLASGKSDLFQVSQEIAYWVNKNIKYDLSTIGDDPTQKASWVYVNRAGVCTDLSMLYVSMMRSIGVPAKLVYGISYSDSDLFEDPWNPHAWAEVYFPDFGWVPFDLTYKQFGFIDASHIKYKDSQDVDTISSSYSWRGRNIEQINLEIIPTEFIMAVKSHSGNINQAFDVDLKTIHSEILPGSYNLVEIKLTNNKDYYVSSLLTINAPKEISFHADKEIPIYLMPKERKKYYVLISVDDKLSQRYIYTMPISVFTSQNTNYNTEFKVASNFKYISIDSVNNYIKENTALLEENNKISISCEFSEEIVYVNNSLEIICSIKNNGNTYLQDGRFCFIFSQGDLNECVNTNLAISEQQIIKTKFSRTIPKSYNVEITADFGDFKESKNYSFVVVEKPRLEISSISMPDDFEVGEIVEIIIQIDKLSPSVAHNAELSLIINNKKYSWSFEEVKDSIELKIPISSYLLKNGENSIEAFLIWRDLTETQYFSEMNVVKNYDHFGFFARIKSWWYRLIN